MKELSIEEKASRYDEVIERAKNTIEVNRNIPDIVECVESLFPALKESEDEMIRENIIATIHLYYGEPLEDEAKEMIAWLEKQGEQKSAELSNDDKQYLIVCKNALFKYQVSDKWDATIISQWLENKVKQAVTQPKQEWSEEDNDMLYKVVHRIEQLDHYWNAPTDEKMIDWFKSPKDRVVPQQKQEWSEEDEELFSLLNTCVCRCITDPYWDYEKRENVSKNVIPFINKLKSLRHQNTWKPSDEQIRQLEYAIYYFKKKNNDTTYLESLYQDLKKLEG